MLKKLRIGGKIIQLKINPKKKKSEITTGYSSSFFPGFYPLQKQPQEEHEISLKTGIEIPSIKNDIILKEEIEDLDEARKINFKYPLIPASPKKGEKVFAYAHIFYDPTKNEIVYKVVEPRLEKNQLVLINEIKNFVQEKVDIDFSQMRKKNTFDYVTKILEESFEYFKYNLDKNTKDNLKYYIFRDFIGLGKIEPFLNDKNIEDISCDGAGINIYIYHRNPVIASVESNVKFDTKNELDYFVNKLAERGGKTISLARPLLDGTLPNGSRIQATLGSDIARRGSNFTIRMFTEKPITPKDLINYNTCDIRMMTYFWMLIEHGKSFLVSGGTATGKTSILNALSLFIKPQAKIVSIEDTAELRLPHAHWVPEVARTPVSEEGKVDMYELLRESLRQRPDYVIVGEVRGKEAFVLFQQMAVGHSGLATIHAETFPKLVDRLTSPPINLAPETIQNLDAIIFLKRIKKNRRYIRRVFNTLEITGFDHKKNSPIINEVFNWNPKNDLFDSENKSILLKQIAKITSMTEKDMREELENRSRVLEYIVRSKINDYRQIGYIINLFYNRREYLMRKIENYV